MATGKPLEGRVALVTGASREKGIGAAIARALAAQGADVFTTYYRPYDRTMPWGVEDREAGSILEGIRALGVRAEGMEADLSDPKSVPRILDAAWKALGPVRILVGNAAASRDADALGLTPELLDEAYGVNVRGTLLLCSEFAKRHDGKAGGRIILMTSGQGEGNMPGEIPYGVTKAALDTFVRNAAPTLAARGITVNALDPGATDSGWMAPELYEQARKANPSGRVGMPEDAARLAAFLASDQAGWVTGQVIRSKGGGW